MQDSQRYLFFTGLWNSFYNRDFYAHIAVSWKHEGILLLLLAIVFSMLPLTYAVQQAIGEFYEQELPFVIRQVPVITIEDGHATSASEEPTLIYSTKGKAEVMVDTSGQYTDPHTANVRLLITRDFIMLAKHSGEIKRFSFNNAEDMVLTENELKALADGLHKWLFPVTVIVLFIGIGVLRAIQVLLYSLFGMLVARFLGMQLSFGGVAQVVMAALSVTVLINIGVEVSGLVLSKWLNLVVTAFYICFGLKAACDWAHKQQQNETDAS